MSKKEIQELDFKIGQRLRIERIKRGMSQGALGEVLGVTFQQIQKYEKGINRVSIAYLVDICRALGIPITDFFDKDLILTHPLRWDVVLTYRSSRIGKVVVKHGVEELTEIFALVEQGPDWNALIKGEFFLNRKRTPKSEQMTIEEDG